MAELKYLPFVSDIELPFYTSLAAQKIDHDQLDDSGRRLLGLYEILPTEGAEAPCRMQIRGDALTADETPPGSFRGEGTIRNLNTIEDYKQLDRAAELNRVGSMIWGSMEDGSILARPSLLASFTMLCFADLKRYKFTYHCAFPALHSDPPWLLDVEKSVKSPNSARPGITHLGSDERMSLVERVRHWWSIVDKSQHGFFLAKRLRRGASQESLGLNSTTGAPIPVTSNSQGTSWDVQSLGQFEHGFFEGTETSDRFICFADPSRHPNYPGWMLRNLLALLRRRWKVHEAQILCFREPQTARHESQSLVLNVKSSLYAEEHALISSDQPLPLPKITGWERNATGKLANKVADLADYMNPQRLADQAINLNLKLMKWRISPNLDLDRIKISKCLLIGAGTLGSHVARNLLAWGVDMITFIDNGKVSFSNPVRQPLFEYKDCLGGGVEKSKRAAEVLATIYPSVESSGHTFSVPMVGHPIVNDEKTYTDFLHLEKLVRAHDVIFLLTDTRESRWLPTVLGKALNKLVMTAALGFDSFVVMRHGVREVIDRDQRLGCYYCNDVVAPANSTLNRTLDQQCTVTRPGVAAIASALLVEMMACVLQHPRGASAPASRAADPDPDHPLGNVPHQIRGFLSTYQNLVVCGQSYDRCSACSERIIDAYIKDGWAFVRKALTERGYVEELSGLAEVQKAAEAAENDLEWDYENGAGDTGDGELI